MSNNQNRNTICSSNNGMEGRKEALGSVDSHHVSFT
eukprot:CAMPEP_0198112126 /NCGR_PEP_ID=MMETSP1442-20131203/4036_1 /TAXON_ID= /ORGANISM="Craspedostauros australis, Strain CCMP3328" /LENGTH=35 /DNA_ID= /DNA_START= /DNA_END= /DNA_ORIENTATION=